MSTEQVITIEMIISDAEYEPRPGLRYEIIRGVHARMKDPTEGVIEAYNEARRVDTSDEGQVTEAAYRAAAAVLEVQDVDINGADRKRCLRGVVDRVTDDFFSLSLPRPSRQMRSWIEAARQSAPAESAPSPAGAASLNGASRHGQETKEPETEGGRTGPSS